VSDVIYSSTAVNAIDSPFYPQEIGEQYPEGRNVIVYYHPKHPGEAVLEPGIVLSINAVDIDSWFLIGWGIYFISMGSAAMKRRNKQSI
jgi:hypothetical protein